MRAIQHTATADAGSYCGGRLEELVASNATLVGYLYTADKPFVVALFSNGSLQWRHDPTSKSIIQGPAELVSEPDRICIGFAAKNPSMPAQGPERYLVCEAVRPIEHSNSLPPLAGFPSCARRDVHGVPAARANGLPADFLRQPREIAPVLPCDRLTDTRSGS